VSPGAGVAALGDRVAMKVARTAWVVLLLIGCSQRPVGRGGRDGGGQVVVVVDPAVSAAWQWTPCWHVPPSPAIKLMKFAPDGALAIMYASGRTVLQAPIWDAPAREITFGSAGDAAFSFDGTLLAGTNTVVRVADGSVVSTLASPRERRCGTDGIRFSLSGEHVMSSGGGGDLCVWRVADGRFVTQIEGGFESAAFQGEQVITVPASFDGIWAIARHDLAGSRLAPPPIDTTGTAGFFRGVVTPDGSTLIARYFEAPDSSTVSVGAWDLTDGRRLWATPDEFSLDKVGFSPRGDLIANETAVLRVRDGTRLRTARAGTGWPIAWAPPSVSPAGDALASVVSERLPLVLDLVTSEKRLLGSHSPDQMRVATLGAFDGGGVRSLSLSRDGGTLISLADGGGIAWRHARGRAPSHPVWLPDSIIYSRSEVSPDGHWVSLVGDGRTLVSVTSLDRLWIAPPESIAVDDSQCVWPQLRFSPDGRWVAGNGYRNSIEILRVDDFTKVAELPAAGCPRVAFTDDGQRLTTSGGQTFSVADWREIKPASVPVPRPGFHDDFVLAPDGVGELRSTCTHEPASQTYHCRTDYRGLRPELTAPFPRFSPEGHWIAAGATLLHVPSGATRTLDAPTALVSTFTPDGDLVAGGSDGSVAGFCRSPGL
jgi:WD40 repeat protein